MVRDVIPLGGRAPFCEDLEMGSLLDVLSGTLWLAVAPWVANAMPQDAWLDQRDFLERRCVHCHSDEDPAGAFDMEPLIAMEDAAFAADPRDRGGYWRYVADRVRSGEMPPEDSRPLPNEERERFVRAVEEAIGSRYDPDLPPDPLAPVVRRLTRREVERTVRDVLGVEVDADRFLPPESVAVGFDNVGSAQSLPPNAVEGILRFAEFVARDAIAWDDPDLDRFQRVTSPEMEELEGRLTTQIAVGGRHGFPRAGIYRAHVAVSADQAGPDLARFRLHVTDKLTRDFEVTSGDPLEPDHHTLEFEVLEAASHTIKVQFLNDYFEPEAEDPEERDRNLMVHSIEIEGPLGAPAMTGVQRELFSRFGEDLGEERLGRVIGELALRLWRRPAEAREIFALEGLSDPVDPFGRRVSVALEALLASTRFHLRFERDEAGTGARALDGYELVTRLSYFLWSSAPDRELLEVAAKEGALEDAELVAQVQRMLRDPRASALAENFAPQWLALTSLADRDAEGTPARLLLSMRRESELLFDAVLREERPVLELLDADFTFVDQLLADHYDLPGVDVAGFQRVSLRLGDRRGILGHAGVLTATSDPGRSSPVLRGKWILDQLLGTPPPPPPDDVPALEESGAVTNPTDLRASLAAHRSNPACASCHASIDPLGFALEGFDELGRRRLGAPELDLTGRLPSGEVVEDLPALAKWLSTDERFVRTLLEKLAVYALGRPLAAPDRGWVARMLLELDSETVSLPQLIKRVVLSPAFRQRSRIEAR